MAMAVRCLGSTWRIRTEGQNPLLASKNTQLGALWHRDLIVSAFFFRDQGFIVPISRSRDGNIAAATATHLGYAPPARGSSSSGGRGAFRKMVTKRKFSQ